MAEIIKNIETEEVSLPLISIIVPVYNAEQYLSKCLNSILIQTFKNWECLLIDDGSFDNSGSICDYYSSRDERFVVIHKENRGVSVARNFGLDNARGEWIIFVDSDDWIDKTCFYDCKTIIDKFEVDIIQFGYRKVKFSGELISEYVYKSRYSDVSEYAQIRHKNLCAAGSLIKADVIRNNHIRFKDGVKYAEDQMFIMNCMKFSQKIIYHGNIYYNYHINLQSAVHNARIDDKIKSCYEIKFFAGDDKFYGRWKDNLLFNFFMDFILNYNIEGICLKLILKDIRLKINNLYGAKRRLVYLLMLLNPSFAIIIIKKMLG